MDNQTYFLYTEKDCIENSYLNILEFIHTCCYYNYNPRIALYLAFKTFKYINPTITQDDYKNLTQDELELYMDILNMSMGIMENVYDIHEVFELIKEWYE